MCPTLEYSSSCKHQTYITSHTHTSQISRELFDSAEFMELNRIMPNKLGKVSEQRSCIH